MNNAGWAVAADGTVRAAQNTTDSSVSNESDRHGEYFAVAVDPRDGNRYRMIAQYMKLSAYAGNSIVASARFEDLAPPAAPPPVPDGATVPGEVLRVERAGGGQLTVRWDATRCLAPGYHLTWYDLASIGAEVIADVTCGAGAGVWTGAPPPGNLAVLAVADDGATEGWYGADGAGRERPTWTFSCGFNTKQTVATCP